jgi:hypothetical protein
MRHWIGLALAGCAAVALRFLPPAEFEPYRETPPQDVVYERALREDAAHANARLQRIRMAERVIPATLSAEGPLAFGAHGNARPEEVERGRADALREAEELLALGGPGDGAPVALGLFYTLPNEGAHPGAPLRYAPEGEFYLGERDGRAYCVAVFPSVFRRRDGTFPLAGLGNNRSRLGVCAAVARYGLPGGAVRRWLESGGAAFASSTVPSRLAPGAFSTAFGRAYRRRGALGLLSTGRGWASQLRTLPTEQCFAGVAAGCADLFLEPGALLSRYDYRYRRGGTDALRKATPLSAMGGYTPLEPADAHVLADLADEFGEERVRRWWVSDGDPAAAFRDAFGIEAGAWYAARVARLVTIDPPGPGVTPMGFLGVLLVLAVGGAAGGAWAVCRRVA